MVAGAVPQGMFAFELPAEADQMLADGGVVVFGRRASAGTIDVGIEVTFGGEPVGTTTASGVVVANPDRYWNGPKAIMAPEAARAAGLATLSDRLLITGADLTWDAGFEMSDEVRATQPRANLNMEEGFTRDQETQIIQWVLFALGAVLMLAGTITATFLALSDAKPDLATLAAVGAAPGTRRALGASYALVVGLIGSVLGAAIGFIPGIAITYPLTGSSWDYDASGPSHYLVIPWGLIIGLVVVLPLVVAAVMWLCTRSRLPMVSRLT